MINQFATDPPQLLRVRIEYAAGTTDTFQNLSSESSMLAYGWQRDEPRASETPGLYTNGAMAFLLFKTMVAQQLSEYSSSDLKVSKLMNAWLTEGWQRGRCCPAHLHRRFQ